MKQIMSMIGMLLVLMAATAGAEVGLPDSEGGPGAAAVSSSSESFDLGLLVVSPGIQAAASPAKKELPPALEPTVLRERVYAETSVFAGIQLDLPTSPLSIVLAADEQMNPACGLQLHLVW